MKTYRTIANGGKGLYREKGSKFLACARPVASREQFKSFLEKLKKEHPKSRHHCFAYRIGELGDDFRTSDDGEPSGTAGKPILGRIDALQLTNVGVIVVRYFGGKLLGAAGLAKAYKAATSDALEQCNIKTIAITIPYLINFQYDQLGKLNDAIARAGLTARERSFADVPSILIDLPIEDAPLLINKIFCHTLGLAREQVGEAISLQGLTFESLPKD